MTEGLILWKEKKQIQKKYVNSEDSIDPKISALCKQKRTPDGRKLELCVFHSYYNENLLQSYFSFSFLLPYQASFYFEFEDLKF